MENKYDEDGRIKTTSSLYYIKAKTNISSIYTYLLCLSFTCAMLHSYCNARMEIRKRKKKNNVEMLLTNL